VVERLLVWGRSVVHLFAQGLALAFWLGILLAFALRFVLGFRADYQLYDAQGNRRKAWRIALGKRAAGRSALSGTVGVQSRVHVSALALPVKTNA